MSNTTSKTVSKIKNKSVIDIKKAVVCVVGAGYVGLPLSQAFARSLKTISYDIDEAKIKKLTKAKTPSPRSITPCTCGST